MQEHYSQEIERLKTNLIKMASLVDDQAERVFNALETGDVELCRGVKPKDLEIDAYDNLITTQCENIFALFQPVAVDLRFVISSLMINNQLERCGDIAVNISQRVKKTSGFHSLIIESGILEMGQKARLMLKNSIDSFIQNNSKLAGEVILNDEEVDKLNKHCFNYLVFNMQADNSLIEPCTHLIVLTRHIERLADHATNIAESLVFYVEARLIAHQNKHPKLPEE